MEGKQDGETGRWMEPHRVLLFTAAREKEEEEEEVLLSLSALCILTAASRRVI